jgi:hypothetical protein
LTNQQRTFDLPLGRLLNVAPGMPTTDVARTVEHYLNWPAPWDGSTPLDAATAKHQRETVAWLRDHGAHSGDLR